MQLNSRQWLVGAVTVLAAAVVLIAPRRFEVPAFLPIEAYHFWLVVWLTVGAGAVAGAVALAGVRLRARPTRSLRERPAAGMATFPAAGGGANGRATELERVMRGLYAEPGEHQPADAALCASAARLRRQNETLLALARGRFKPAESLPAALWPLTEAACQTLETERASIWRLTPDRTAIECVDLYERAGDSHTSGPRLAVADYPSYFAALAHARTIAAHDAATDPRTRELGAGYLGPLGIASVLVAPVRRCGAVVGVVCLEQMGLARRWAPDDENFAGAVADFVSLTLEADERRRADEALCQEGERLRQGQKIEAISQLAAGVAHDFNVLVSVINDCSEILALGLAPHHPHRTLVDEIAQAGNRAGLLTQQLLAFSRRQILAPCRLDLNVVLDDTGELLRRLIGDEVELVTRLRLGLGPVEVDPGQLQQVILHLAVNAREAMPRGGTLTLETSAVEVPPSAVGAPGGAAPGAYVALSVRDTGRGMDEATRARIFEPFFTLKEPGQGTGLGLATVHGIVTQSGGYLTCKSAPGLGTVFTILLPRAADQSGLPADQPATVMAMARGKETVLLVEAEAQVRSLARAVLEEFGYTVLAASHAEEALRLNAEHDGSIHLLLTDIVTPGQSGREVAAAVRAVRPDTRVLYISGYTDDVILRDGVTAVDSALLLKPFVPATLLAKVRAVLDSAARRGTPTAG